VVPYLQLAHGRHPRTGSPVAKVIDNFGRADKGRPGSADPAGRLDLPVPGTPAGKRDELAGQLRDKPGLRRFLRRTKTGLLRIGHAAIARERHLDGKWLLRTSDLTLTPDDLAAAYKQLIAVERGWRDMKGALALRPVFHYREDRIRAHVQLCWLALLLARVAENATGGTWRNLLLPAALRISMVRGCSGTGHPRW